MITACIWHEVLDPLAAVVRRWEAGDLDHVDLARAAMRFRTEASPFDDVCGHKREMVVRMSACDGAGRDAQRVRR